jgi:hypothetical protein
LILGPECLVFEEHSKQEILTMAINTQHKTIDGLYVYDLAPQAAYLLAVAGPDGYDEPINQDKLPEGFRWVSDTEWESLMLGDEAQKVRVDDEGFVFTNLLFPGGLQDDVLITEGMVTARGEQLYGVFASVWHARQPDADDRCIGTVGGEFLTKAQRDFAERNSALL